MSVIESAELKEMIGKRITIDGERHRVAKVAVRAGTLTTEDGAVIDVEGIYRRGRGYFYDTPKKSKKAKKEKEETPAQRRKREKEEKTASDTGRARNRGGKKAEEETPRRKRIPRDEKPSTKKKLVKAFDQAIAERIVQDIHNVLGKYLDEESLYAVTPVAAGAQFEEDAILVGITLMSSEKSKKEIDAFIRNNRKSTDVSPADEEEDDLEDEDLEDDDAEDEEIDDEEEEDLEDEEDDEEEEDEDLEDDEEEESDDEEEEDDEEESDDEELSVDDLVSGVLESYPDLKEAKVRTYVEAYLTSDTIEDKFGDELIPGVTRLQKKGSKLELLLVGFDETSEEIKLVNTETGKFRSASIDDVVRMEVLDEEEEEDDE